MILWKADLGLLIANRPTAEQFYQWTLSQAQNGVSSKEEFLNKIFLVVYKVYNIIKCTTKKLTKFQGINLNFINSHEISLLSFIALSNVLNTKFQLIMIALHS